MAITLSSTFYKDVSGPYSTMLQKRDRGIPISPEDLTQAGLKVLSNGISNPFIYSVVRNKDKALVGHLIGTSHKCNQQMLENLSIQKVVLACGRFFIESLNAKISHLPLHFIRNFALAQPPFERDRSKLNLLMDYFFYVLAKSNNIECEVLETDEELKILKKARIEETGFQPLEVDASHQEPERTTEKKENLEWLHSRTEEERDLETVEFYQRGSALQIHRFMQVKDPKDLQAFIFQRNQLWASRSILPALNNVEKDKKPICIMVGVHHLLGAAHAIEQTSIIKLLREQGFTVSREDYTEKPL